MSEQRLVFNNADGTVGIIIPAPGFTAESQSHLVPADATNVQVVDAEALPEDRLFRAAWTVDGEQVVECPLKSRDVAHEIRRAKRAEEFAPHDQVIALRLPGEEAAEAEREAIRVKYAIVQEDIDAAGSAGELKSILGAI